MLLFQETTQQPVKICSKANLKVFSTVYLRCFKFVWESFKLDKGYDVSLVREIWIMNLVFTLIKKHTMKHNVQQKTRISHQETESVTVMDFIFCRSVANVQSLRVRRGVTDWCDWSVIDQLLCCCLRCGPEARSNTDSHLWNRTRLRVDSFPVSPVPFSDFLCFLSPAGLSSSWIPVTSTLCRGKSSPWLCVCLCVPPRSWRPTRTWRGSPCSTVS